MTDRSARVERALRRAESATLATSPVPTSDGRPTRHVAIGDPQGPIDGFFVILDEHGLLGDDGYLAPDLHLVSMGDHFDWGGPADRARAAKEGGELLAWLAAHPRERVTILLGNHDLARVGELSRFDDASFRAAQSEADGAYLHRAPKRDEREFREWAGLPSWEIASRDFSTFEASQRRLVAGLLERERVDIAWAAAPDLLLTHAGVTTRELRVLGLPEDPAPDAFAIAAALSQALVAAVSRWKGRPGWEEEPLVIPGLHAPGTKDGEGRGMFYHRPTTLADDDSGRRYPVTALPAGLVQGIGHIRDAKSRKLLGVAAAHDEPEGAIHHAVVRDGGVTYGRGVPSPLDPRAATLLFLDGGMREARPGDYELLDLDTRTAARRVTR